MLLRRAQPTDGPKPTFAASRRHGLAAYYGSVAPFYEAEMGLRDDLDGWITLARAASARSALDLGCGGGRVALALAGFLRVVGIDLQTRLLPADPGFAFVQADMRALPFAGSRFDLALAANDPFAHLLTDTDRARAIDEALRVAGRLVVDGLALPAADEEEARSGEHIREATLPDGTERRETWRALGGHRYRTIYHYARGGRVLAEAETDVRSWSRDEPALRGRAVQIAGGLDGRAYDRERP